MLKTIKKQRVRSFKKLQSICTKVLINDKIELLIPEGVYCLEDTGVILDADEEYNMRWYSGVVRERLLQGTVLISGL